MLVGLTAAVMLANAESSDADSSICSDNYDELILTDLDLTESPFGSFDDEGIRDATSSSTEGSLEYIELYSGKCGDDATYKFDPASGLLTICGSGAMYDYVNENGSRPWDSFGDDLITVDFDIDDCFEAKGYDVFYGYAALVYTFYDGFGFVCITVPELVTFVVLYTDDGCICLPFITIGKYVYLIGYGAFGSCTELTSVTFDDSIISIGNYAFDGCTALTSVTLPATLTSIGAYAFSNCSALTSITIPESVAYIGENAFEGAFYAADGTELEPTAANLAGSTFNKIEGKWIRAETSVPDVEPEPEVEPTDVSGICGNGVTFEFVASTGTLTLSGSGEMFSNGTAPWYYFDDAISTLVIGDSVAYIGENAFEGAFYAADGTELEPTAANLAGSTFNKIEGNWIKIEN